MLGKFASVPSQKHWKVMKHLLHYLKGNKEYGLFISKGRLGGAKLEAWSDAEWSRDLDRSRSLSGVLFIINEVLVIWSSKFQTFVALSTAKAEFSALSDSIRQVLWTRPILEELSTHQSTPKCVHKDNLGTISWTKDVHGICKWSMSAWSTVM